MPLQALRHIAARHPFLRERIKIGEVTHVRQEQHGNIDTFRRERNLRPGIYVKTVLLVQCEIAKVRGNIPSMGIPVRAVRKRTPSSKSALSLEIC